MSLTAVLLRDNESSMLLETNGRYRAFHLKISAAVIMEDVVPLC
jgi:hypothetical protein